MSDTSKPNPNYVPARFEMAEWNPEDGFVNWIEEDRAEDGTIVLKGKAQDGRVLTKHWKFCTEGTLFVPAQHLGERDCMEEWLKQRIERQEREIDVLNERLENKERIIKQLFKELDDAKAYLGAGA